MRVLHATALLQPLVGLVNQLVWEQDAAMAANLPWDTRFFCPSGLLDQPIAVESSSNGINKHSHLSKVAAWVRLRIEFYSWLRTQEPMYDLILLRYNTHDLFQLRYLRRAAVPVLLVHHTLEVPELKSAGTLGAARALLEGMIGSACIRAADGIIGVTREIARYELSRAQTPEKWSSVYPNGILYRQQDWLDGRGTVPELLFVAGQFAPWHGLDLLLDAVARSEADFVLHVVGNVGANESSRCMADRRIILHGRLAEEAIRDLASRCWIGLSSFGLFRNRMEEACTLKVREYLMLGLPVYAGYSDVFPDTFPFFAKGPADLDVILSYARSMRTQGKARVSAEARPYIDKTVLLRDVYERLKKQNSDFRGGEAEFETRTPGWSMMASTRFTRSGWCSSTARRWGTYNDKP